jgi:hypothetical protein
MYRRQLKQQQRDKTPTRSSQKRRFVCESLESRLYLAQTTGLFFNDPAASDGYVLFAPNTSTATYLIDKDANVVNQWVSNYSPGLAAYLLEDGSMVREAAPNGQGGNGSINAAGAGGLLEWYDWSGNKFWEFSYDSTTVLGHHDFEVMPNGNILMIAWEYKTEAEATQAGRNPALAGDGYLYPDHIVEVQPDLINGGGAVVWEWHIWDHLVQEFDATKNNWYGATGVEDHPELIDVNYVSDAANGGGQREDWTHANGIEYNAELDQIALSVREFSEFWIIDHSTTTAEAAGHTGGNSGKGGDLLYRWGNPEAYDRGSAADRKLFFQHDARWIEDGSPGARNITIFNNGFGRPGTDFTSIEEIAPPVDVNGNYSLAPGQPYGPASTVWTFAAPLEDYSAIISSAVRLPNGNTFIDYGVDGTFKEVTPAGVEVWKFVNPYTGFGTLGMEDPIPSLGLTDPGLDALRINFTFQAQHYPVAYIPQLNSTVAGRHIFYNQSSYDGSNAAIQPTIAGVNNDDEDARDTSKVALLPGAGAATWANITGYDKGINGIMIDLSTGVDHSGLTLANVANNFIFKVGNNNTPANWAVAPAPNALSVIAGGGVSGSDRVVITWTTGAITKKWLEVAVLPTAQTGLAATAMTVDPDGPGAATPVAAGDVFFFGNAVGGSGDGDTATAAPTNASDELGARNNPHNLANPALVTDAYDYNKNRFVDANDQLIARNNPTNLATQLIKINIGTAGPFAPEGDGDAGIASALASSAMSIAEAPRILPQNSQNVARLDDAVSLSVTNNTDDLLTDDQAETLQVADDADEFFAVDVDEDLLDVLAGAL